MNEEEERERRKEGREEGAGPSQYEKKQRSRNLTTILVFEKKKRVFGLAGAHTETGRQVKAASDKVGLSLSNQGP